jgi:hypothetical protein
MADQPSTKHTVPMLPRKPQTITKAGAQSALDDAENVALLTAMKTRRGLAVSWPG